MGWGLMFKLDDESIERRKGEEEAETRDDQVEQVEEEEVEMSSESSDEEKEEQFPDVEVSYLSLLEIIVSLFRLG
jgi:hypothetical protein